MNTYVSRVAALAVTLCLSGASRAQEPALDGSQRVAPSELSAEAVSSLSVADLLARMPTKVWQRRNEAWVMHPVADEMRRRVESGLLTDADWRVAIALADVIHTRRKWVEGTPLMVWIREPAWLRRARITAEVTDPALGRAVADNLNPSWCGNCRQSQLNRQRTLTLGEVPANTSRLLVSISIDQAENPGVRFGRGGTHSIWTGVLELPLEAVPHIEAVLAAAEQPTHTQALRDSLTAYWLTPEGGSRPTLCLGASSGDDRLPQGIGISLEVELSNQGASVLRSTLVANQRATMFEDGPALQGYSMFRDLPPELATTGADTSGWLVRVRGTADSLLSVWEADRWWKGELAIPLSELLARAESK